VGEIYKRIKQSRIGMRVIGRSECSILLYTHTHTQIKSDCIQRTLKVFTYTYKKDSNSSKAPEMLRTADVS